MSSPICFQSAKEPNICTPEGYQYGPPAPEKSDDRKTTADSLAAYRRITGPRGPVQQAGIFAPLVAFALLILGCGDDEGSGNGNPFDDLVPEKDADAGAQKPDRCEVPDEDEDGSDRYECGGYDCDDGDPTINGKTEEITGNSIDENCNGMSDGDEDGDGVTSDNGDCNDQNAAISPENEEITGNNTDENCNGMADADADGDGFMVADDCNDYDPAINPNTDQDGDCWVAIQSGGEDCDDSNASINPGASENMGNNVDDNCNGSVDELTVGCNDDSYSLSESLEVAEDGDTIYICSGTYGGYYGTNKDLTITGGSPIFTGGWELSGSPHLVMNNLGFEGQVADDPASGIRANLASYGSGAADYEITVNNCTFVNNALGQAGAIELFDDGVLQGTLIINNSYFYNNELIVGLGIGGALFFRGTLLHVSNSEFYANAGVLYLDGGEAVIEDSYIHNNTEVLADSTVYMDSNTVLESVNTVWEDNFSYDIYAGGTSYTAGEETDFICTSSGGCSPSP